MWKQILCVVVLLLGCKKAPVQIDAADVAVGWRSLSGDLKETEYMAIRADRQMEVSAKQRDGTFGRVQVRISEAQYSELIEELRKLDCCSLKSASRRQPNPGEMQSQLEIHADGMDCLITRWNSGWREGRARECGLAAAKVHGRGFLPDDSAANDRAPAADPAADAAEQ